MINEDIKIGWRIIRKNKVESLVKLSGLVIGMSSLVLVGLYILSQQGYDQSFKNHDRIYRIRTEIANKGSVDFNSATASPPLARLASEEIPGILEYVRVVNGEYLLTPKNSTTGFYETSAYAVDSNFLSFFNYPLLEGSPETALRDASSLALSKNLARKIFGENKAIGSVIYLGSGDEKIPLTVTAVYDDSEVKSHLKPHFLINLRAIPLGNFVLTAENLVGQNFVTQYLLLEAGTSAAKVEKAMNQLLQERVADKLVAAGMEKQVFLQALDEIYLGSAGVQNNLEKVSSSQYLAWLGAIALFILLMALANYVNLTTAQASGRTREIGVRKVIGATRSQLTNKFLSESVLFTFLALVISIPLVMYLIPYFNQWAETDLKPSMLFAPRIALLMVGSCLFVGLLAGTYPAFYLSELNVMSVFKNKTGKRSGSGVLKDGLVVFQLMMVFMLTFSVFMVHRQLEFLIHKDIGLQYENKIYVPLKTGEAQSEFDVLQSRISGISGVKSVSGTEFLPSRPMLYDTHIYRSLAGDQAPLLTRINLMHPGYLSQMGIPMVEGRGLLPSDSGRVVVNEAFVRDLQMPNESVVGKTFYIKSESGESESFEVVGVHRDFNQVSLKVKIAPTMTYIDSRLDHLVIDYEGNAKDVNKAVAAIWSETLPGIPFEPGLLSDKMADMYQEESHFRSIALCFSLIAILLGVLGIWGLVSHSTHQRFKEIGLRKTFGASIAQVYLLISKKYIFLVGMAAIIALFPTVLLGKKWLAGFEYQDGAMGLNLASAFIITMFIAILAMSYSVMKAASMNPTLAIKNE